MRLSTVTTSRIGKQTMIKADSAGSFTLKSQEGFGGGI